MSTQLILDAIAPIFPRAGASPPCEGLTHKQKDGGFVMISKTIKKSQLGIVLSAALVLGTTTAFAGEITGNGKKIDSHARSECAYSGLQDDAEGDAGVFKGDRVQNWGQLTDFGRWVFEQFFGITSPSQGCNPNWDGGDPI